MFWGALALALLASRLAHRNILWADEDYHLAAAIQILHGQVPYRDFWYDKPPLTAIAALLFGAQTGVLLRVAGAAVAFAVCVAGDRLARELWSPREGRLCAGLLAFFQILYFPSAILPFEPDTLTMLPHLAALYWMWRERSLWAGVAAAAAFWISPKGVFVLAACLLFVPGPWKPAVAKFATGFTIPSVLTLLALWGSGSLEGYVDQVWRWGWLYASTPGSQRGWAAVGGWMGFHAALIVAAINLWRKDRDSLRWRLLAWIVLAASSAAIGLRFAPRYFDAVLVAMAVAAARGLAMMPRPLALASCALLLIPAARFGPRYATLAWEDLQGRPHAWQDVAMDQESRGAAAWLAQEAHAGDTVFIWGYRPNVVAYSRLPVASRFWDSQAVTGVPADRHLTDSRPVASEWAARNRAELALSRPAFLVDGLSAYNRGLDIHSFADLAPWLANYCEAARLDGITIYRRCAR